MSILDRFRHHEQAQTTTVICPECHEENPVTAMICVACKGALPPRPEQLAQLDREKEPTKPAQS